MNDPLTMNEMKLAARLMKLAADKFSNHGCNDFDMQMSKEEAQPILLKRERWNGDDEEVKRLTDIANIRPEADTDWYMMSYLAERMLNASTQSHDHQIVRLEARAEILRIEKEHYYAEKEQWKERHRETKEALDAEEQYSYQLAAALRPYAHEAARWDGIANPPTNRDTTVVKIDCRIGYFVAAREAMERPKADG